MLPLGIWALSLVIPAFSQEPAPQPPRFRTERPLPTLPGVLLDRRLHGNGVANGLIRSKRVQGRMLWIDATANLDRFGDEAKIIELVARIADSGFNTIVFDVKPISGQVVYKSKFAPKILEWKGKKLAPEFDPLPYMVREAKRNKLQIYLSLNAFSEGHSLFKAGPGYAHADWQTTLYEPVVFAEFESGSWKASIVKLRVDETFNRLVDPSSGHLSAFNDAARVPKTLEQGFAVTIDAKGRFIDGYEIIKGVPLPTIPTGGSMLIAQDASGTSLRNASLDTRSVKFVVEAALLPISERPAQQYPLITDPTNPEIVSRNLAIVDELVSGHDVDGILYDDRLRFSGMTGDFGPRFRAEFERWLGRRVARWPEDVYHITYTPNLVRGLKPGKDYENWMLFRALTMKRYVQTVSRKVKSIRPNAQFGIYAGSWYGEYPSFGVNYASVESEGGFWFMSPAYQKTGFAGELDLLVTGCYYPTATIHDAMSTGRDIGRTIEASAALSTSVANDATWVYAGIALEQFRNDPAGLRNAIQAACGASQGVMVFDLSHNIDPMWPVFKQAFSQPVKPPTTDGLVMELRRQKAIALRHGQRRPPIIVSTGQPGAGH